jgi:glycosyltransferase involved in cell wall biosynthesis
MDILFLSAWCPFPADNGSKLRIYHLLRGLSGEHEVDLISFCPEDHGLPAERLRELCREVVLVPETPFAGRRAERLAGYLSLRPRSMVGNHSPTMASLVRRKAAERRYDLVIASQLHMLPYALVAGPAPKLLEELELLAYRDLFLRAATLAARARSLLTWWKIQRYLTAMLPYLGGVSVVSADEAAVLAKLAPPTLAVDVVPNGVDVSSCLGPWGSPAPDTLIYPGALSFDANFDAVGYYLSAIHPQVRAARPDARLRVTGRVSAERIAALPPANGVEWTGYLDDVRPAVAEAWAEVVPLRTGGGTRLKVLEALALGTPVISTRKGVEGLKLRAGHDVLVADTPDEFAAQTVRLLESATLRAKLAVNGRQAVQQYDWGHSVERLLAFVERVRHGRSRRRVVGR